MWHTGSQAHPCRSKANNDSTHMGIDWERDKKIHTFHGTLTQTTQNNVMKRFTIGIKTKCQNQCSKPMSCHGERDTHTHTHTYTHTRHRVQVISRGENESESEN